MATYVNDLRLKEISTGDESGTWGTSTNTNLELIGEALGYATEQSFGSDADATTTVADGVSDPARAMYFKVTSAGNLTATRTLTIAPNTVSRVMFIENATSGSQSIAISQGSGANVTIATGKTAIVYLDGAGSGAAVVDAMAGVDPGVTDTLAEVLTAGNTTGGTSMVISSGDDVTFTGASANIVFDSSNSALEFADNAKAIFGAGSDLSIYHDGFNSYIDESGNGDIRIRSGNVYLDKYTGETMLHADADGAVTAYFDNAAKLATTSTGIDVTGVITTDGMTTSADINFGDNDKAIFGAGSDLQIYHDGNDSYVQDSGTGLLFIRGSSSVRIQGANGESSIDANENGAVNLYYDNSNKLSTTSTGITVSGAVGAPSSEDFYRIKFQDQGGIANDVGIGQPDADSLAFNFTPTAGGHIAFFAGSSEKVRIDASGRVGIGTTPDALLRVNGTAKIGEGAASNTAKLMVNTASGTAAGIQLFQDSVESWIIDNPASSTALTFSNSGTERMRIGASGDLTVKGGRIFVNESDNGNTAVAITRDADEGYVNVYSSGTQTVEIRGNGNSYFNGGNVGIGTSSPYSALTVDTANGILNIANGNSSGGTKIQAWGATPTNGYLAIEGYDKEYLRVDSSGNVNIGTTSAYGTNVLNVNGGVAIDGRNASTPGLCEKGDVDTGIFWPAANSLSVTTGGTERFNIDSSGNATVKAAGELRIRDDGTFIKEDQGLQIGNTSGTGTTRPIRFFTESTERMRIDASGNVSVSSSAGLIENAIGVFMLPAGELRVKDSTEDGTAQISIYNNNVTSDAEQFFVGNNLADVDIGNKRGALKFFANSVTERMRINSSGNLLVGTTAGSFSAKLTVENSSSYTFESRRTGTGSEGHVVFRNANGAVGSIFTNGSTTSYNTSSDQRLKENIADADDAGSKVDAIQVRKFDWIADGSHQDYGMVAQELQSVAPEAVSGDGDSDEMMAVDYSKLVPMLVKEIQSLRARVQQLENS